MKQLFVTLGLMLCLSGMTQAGYRSVPGSEIKSSGFEIKTADSTAAWEATVTREDGRVITLKNLGDRFASQTLMRGEKIDLCLVIPGIKIGTEIYIASTHGGKVDNQDRATFSATEKEQVCIPYTMGAMGSHPVIVTVNGKSATLLFQVEEEVTPKATREQKQAKEFRQ